MAQYAVLVAKNPPKIYEGICAKIQENVTALRSSRKETIKKAGAKLERELSIGAVHNYERVYIGSALQLDQIEDCIKDAIKKANAKHSQEPENGSPEITCHHAEIDGQKKFKVATVLVGSKRFTQSDAPEWASKFGHTHLYTHQENGLHYIKDRNDIIVRRYVKRAITKDDLRYIRGGAKNPIVPHTQGKNLHQMTDKEANTFRDDWEKFGAPLDRQRDMNRRIKYQLSQGSNRMISTTSTKHPIHGSTGSPFTEGGGGIVLIDLLGIKKDLIIDVHNPDALSRALGYANTYDWKSAINKKQGNTGTDIMFRDTIRTREILIDGWIPINAIIHVSEGADQGKYWWLDGYSAEDKKIIKDMYPDLNVH